MPQPLASAHLVQHAPGIVEVARVVQEAEDGVVVPALEGRARGAAAHTHILAVSAGGSTQKQT